MKKPNFQLMVKSAKCSLKRHSPQILTGIGIAGMITTVVLSVRATPKALILLEEKKNENQEDLTVSETVKATWKCYIPAAATGVLSIFCIIGATSLSAKRQAALAAAYSISETALKEYQGKVVETIGEKKEQSIRDAIAKDKVDANPVSKTVVVETGKGNTLCYDALFGRYFYSDIDVIKRAENEANRCMMNEMYIPLNHLYQELNMPDVGGGEMLGWGMMDGFIDIAFSTQISDDGRPCLVMSYSNPPRYDYQDRY